MFNNPAPGNAPNATAKKPTIRRETVLVPVKKTPNPNGVRKPAHPSSASPSSRFQLSKSKSASGARKPQAPAQRAIAASRALKRKSTTPDRVVFSDEEDDSATSDSDASRKRLRLAETLSNTAGPRRRFIADTAFGERQSLDIVHGADCTSGTDESKYTFPWNFESFDTAELQYPSNSARERFELKWPKNQSEDYRPMDDIIQTVTKIVQYYFPEELVAKYMGDENDTAFERRFNRMWKRESVTEFKAIVEDFNSVLAPLVKDGTIKKELSAWHSLPLELVQRILDQIYSRTVSPRVESLRAYKNGTDYVYGELLSRFCSSVFRQVQLTEDHIFVDLGSGVGNVVLQAALEVGCESWGIEYMKNPCDLAELQAKEFPGRAQLWGLKVGDVNLLRGDFTQNIRIAEVLKRADVVLVNNQAFTPGLNDKLRDIFLDLKSGCKVVSLKPFVPDGHKISMRNIGSVENLFVQQKFEYFSNSVSWTNEPGSYYIATLDRRPLDRFLKANGQR